MRTPPRLLLFGVALLTISCQQTTQREQMLASGGQYDVQITEPMNAHPRSIAFLSEPDNPHTIVEMPQTREYLRSILKKLIDQTPKVDRPIKVDVFVHSEGELIGASATPGDDIIIKLSALDGLETEGELAFLLSHELGHIVLGHTQRESFLTGNRRAGDIVAKLGLIASALAATEIDVVGGNVTTRTDESYMQTATELELVVRALQVFLEGGLNPAWSRGQEEEADEFGIDLMEKAGYNPFEATVMLNRLGDNSGDLAERTDLLLTKAQILLTALYHLRAENEWQRALGQVALEGTFFLGRSAFSAISEMHDPVRDRIKNAQRYINEFHQNAATRLEDPDVETRYRENILQSTEIRRTRQLLEPAWSIEGQIYKAAKSVGEDNNTLSGDESVQEILRAADEEAQRALSGGGGSVPFNRLMVRLLRERQGRYEDAFLNVKRIEGQANEVPTILSVLAFEHARAGNRAEALQAVERLESKFEPVDGPLYDIQIRVFHELGDRENRDRIARQCDQAHSAFVGDKCATLAQQFTAEDRASEEKVPGKTGTEAITTVQQEDSADGPAGFFRNLVDELGLPDADADT